MFHGNLPTLPMSKSAKPCSPHGILQFFVPPHIIFTVSKFAEYSHFPGYLSLLSTFFIFMTSFINPFIYGYMNRAFITEFKKCFLPKRGHSVTNELATRRSRNLQAARSKEKIKRMRLQRERVKNHCKRHKSHHVYIYLLVCLLHVQKEKKKKITKLQLVAKILKGWL